MSGRSRKQNEEPPARLTGAFGSLEDTFREAGEQKEAARTAGERQPRTRRSPGRGLGRRWLGPVVGAITAFCVVGAGVAISTDVFTADGGSAGSGPKPPDETRHAPGDAYRGNAVAADPSKTSRAMGRRRVPEPRTAATRACWPAGSAGKRWASSKTVALRASAKMPQAYATTSMSSTPSSPRGATSDATGDRALLYGLVDRTVTSLRLGLSGRAQGRGSRQRRDVHRRR